MTSTWPEKRAFTVSIVGLFYQLLLSTFLLLLWLWNNSEATHAVLLLAACGLPIWLFLALIYKQRQYVREEMLESEQLRQERAASGTSAALFAGDEALLLAKKKLDRMFRIFLPVFTIILVGLLTYFALRHWSWMIGFNVYDKSWIAPKKETVILSMAFSIGAAFLTFLMSRYATGMSRQGEWRLLRAGAGYLMGNALACTALAAVLGFIHYDVATPERVAAQAIRILMLVLAAEFLLNFVLDFYRPRHAGEEPRPAFDSRILALFCEPGGIAHSIAEAMNYQFGFQVSSTWFYKLMQRAATPVLFFGVITLFAISCLVVVDTGDVVIVERFGRPLQAGNLITVEKPDGRVMRKVEALGPGLHRKWPWPIDKAYQYPTERLLNIVVGTVEDAKVKEEGLDKPLTWKEKHEWIPHLNVLVATEAESQYTTTRGANEGTASASTRPSRTGRSVPVSMLRLSVPIHYQIDDLKTWRERFIDPEKAFNDLAYRVVTKYSAAVDIDQVMGADRHKVAGDLKDILQKEATRYGLGVRIISIGLQSVHPPTDVAKEFEAVIGAESQKRTAIRTAEAERIKILSEMCGDVLRAERLAEAISQLDQPGVSPEEREKKQKQAEELFNGNEARGILPITGKAAERVAVARAEMWAKINEARADADTLELELPIYRAAPRIYRMRRYLDVLNEGLANTRKYLIAADVQPVIQFDLTEPRVEGLADQLLQEKK